MMKEEVKKKWVEALRSGEFTQAQGYLRIVEEGSSPRYCCLGVLCELMRREFPQLGNNLFFSHYLPQPVMEWSGLTDHNPRVRSREESHTLSNLNDHGASFETIADLIEAQL